MNVTIRLENQFVVREENETPNVKILMLKGDKGDTGQDGTVSFDSLTEEQKAELKGDPGDDYVLTSEDKEEIAEIIVEDHDTGWVDLSSYANSYITPSSDYFMGRRIGNVVHLRLNGTAASAFGGNAWQAVTSAIPENFRPDYISIHVMDSSMSDTDLIRLKVDPDGIISVYRRGSNIPSGQWFRGDIVYTVDGELIET